MGSKQPSRRASARDVVSGLALSTTTETHAVSARQPGGLIQSALTRLRARVFGDWTVWLTVGIAVFALLLRLYGINWDFNNHLHPDEREITFCAMGLSFPGQPHPQPCNSLYAGKGGFFSIDSPLNPHFFAYGSFPIYLLALVAHGLAMLTAATHGAFHPSDGGLFDDYNHFTLVGRALSALFDTGSVVVGGLIARKLGGRWAGLLAAAMIAVIPLNVQVSHFYAVDTPTLFFILLTMLACVTIAQYATRTGAERPNGRAASRQAWMTWGLGAFVGVAFGLAMATKISAAPLLAPILLTAVLVWRRKGLEYALIMIAGVGFAAIIAFVITSPYALIDYKDFLAQNQEQTQLSQGLLDYPYVRQFAGDTPYLYQLRQMFLYDMGVPLTLVGAGGLAWVIRRVWRRWDDDWTLMLAWIIPYFAIIGDAYTQFSRYMLPIFAPLAICGACGLVALIAWGKSAAQPAWGRPRLAPAQWARPAALALAAIALIGAGLEALAIDNLYSAENTRVAASEWIYNHVAPHSVITSEVWDDPLPIAAPAAYTVNGTSYTSAGHVIDPYEYGNIGLDLYANDTTDKAQTLATQLSAANVVVISSQRLLRSIPKLPTRYPMTIQYYQLLFAGKLGFHLAATFQSQPSFLGITWNDSGADESFSVYDHPPVWIFVRDGAGLSPQQINAELVKGVNFDTVTPNLSGSQKSLTLTPQNATADQQSPPLAVQFPPNSLANQQPLLWWLFVVELLGLLAFPLTFIAFRGLRDRGWGFSKLVGLLLIAWLVWFPSSFRLLPFTSTTVAGAFAVVAAAGAAVAWFRRVELLAFVRARGRLLVACETLFVAGFLLFAWIRALDPDLWHIYRGGEKPMELAFVNAILRSRYMPPLDPWFSGGAINYYYYGQYLVATLIRLTGVTTTTAFNLMIPLLFGMTLTGAFSIVAGVTRRWWTGIAAGIAIALVANLDGLWQALNSALSVLRGAGSIPFDYWASSRVIPYTINEFPFWSFLYADVHAHVIDLPIVILIVGLGASLLVRARRDGGRWRPALSTLALGALALGATWCVNTWDLPFCAALLVLICAIRLLPLHSERTPTWRAVFGAITWPVARSWGLAIGALLAATYALYLPFHMNFQNFTSGIGTVTTPTDPRQFLTLFGIWMFLIVSFLIVELHDRLKREAAAYEAAGSDVTPVMPPWSLALIILALLLIVTVIRLEFALALLLILGGWLAFDLRHSPTKLLTYILTLFGLAIATGVEIIYLKDFLDGGAYERMNTVFKFYYQVWVCFALSGALIFSQLLPRALGLFDVRREPQLSAIQASQPSTLSGWGWTPRVMWVVALAALLGGSMIFDTLGTQARVNDPTVWVEVQPPSGGVQPQGLSLDGMAYMKGWYPEDYTTINWINAHIAGAPTIVEASNGPYAWYNRVSIYTGLPDVLGWNAHEEQQRYPDQVQARQNAVENFYLTTDPNAALQFLRDYQVSYIYMGGLERTCISTDPYGACIPLPASSLTKFDALEQQGYIKPVFTDGATVLYEVVHL
jgi:YYY domain-containing protein